MPVSLKPEPTKADAIATVQAYIKQNIVKVLFESCFPMQQMFIENKSRLKALVAARRIGKSTLACYYLLITALSYPETRSVFIGLTRDSAKDVKDLYFKPIIDKFNIDHVENLADLTFRFANGSVIKFHGMDNSEKDRAKLRGPKYKLAVIDEAQDFTTDLEKLVYDVLQPAMTDLQGTICLFGTPKDFVSLENPQLFFSVTYGIHRKARWFSHTGKTADNPIIAPLRAKELEDILEFYPDFKSSSTYLREWEGKWVISDDSKIYNFHPIRNVIPELPPTNDKYIYLMGLDFGFVDATAFVIGAYAPHDPNLYIVKTFKKTEMTIDDIDEKLREFHAQYRITKIISDHSKQLVESLRHRLHYNFVAAEKKDKFDYISLMNDDMQAGKIKLLPGNDELKTEWAALVYDSSSGKPAELASCENHLADSCLYLWRSARHYLATVKKTKLDKNSEDYMHAQVMAELQRKSQQSDRTQAEIDFDAECGYEQY